MDSLFETLAQLTKPNKNAELIKELDNSNYFIIRNDGLILRNEIGNYNIFSAWEVDKKITDLHEKCKRWGANYTFSYKLIADYKKENPSFKF